MKLKIEQKELNKLLSKVYPIIPTKTTMPALLSILMEAKEDKVFLSATDLECAITTKGTAEIIEEGAIGLNGKEFYNIVKELPASTLEIEVINLTAKLRCEKGRYNFPGIDKDKFPKLLNIDKGATVTLPIEDLKEGIDKVLFIASALVEGGATLLKGCLLDLRSDELRLVATDGHELALFKSKVEIKHSAELFIPSKIWKELLSFSSVVDVIFDDTKVSFSSGDTVLVTRLIEGNFPPYESVFPQDNDKELIISREKLLSVIKRAIVFSPDISKLIKFELTSDKLIVESTSESGEGKEEIECKYKGDSLAIGYNASYFVAILGRIESDEIKMSFKDPATAGIITPSSKEEGTTYLLMPIRLE